MEKIGLNNYEAYFLDYMEGTLSAEEKHDLFAFLELHPELKAEMEEDFGMVELMPERVSFDAKESLKIDESKLIITPATVDDLMIASIEKQLTEAHKAELNAYIKSNGLEKTYAYYQSTILEPDTSIIFEDKQSLKQRTGIVISMRFVSRVAAVAAVGLLLISVGMNWNSAEGDLKPATGGSTYFADDVRGNQTLDLVRKSGQTILENNESSEDNYQAPVYQVTPSDFEEFDRNEIAAVGVDVMQEETDTLEEKENTPEITLPDHFEDLDDIVEGPGERQLPDENEGIIVEETMDDVAEVAIKREEPYKLVTDAASNIVNRDIKFTRDKHLASNDYVAYGFKLGKFEFERKKSK